MIQTMPRHAKRDIDRVIALNQIRLVCLASKKYTGYQLETFFEPPDGYPKSTVNIKRTNKFDRLMKGTFKASNKTMEKVRSIFPNILDVREIPFWQAFLPIDDPTFSFQDFYRQCNPKINYLLTEVDEASSTEHTIKLLIEIASMDTTESFVCLCLKLQEAKNKNQFTLYLLLEKWTSFLFMAGLEHNNYLSVSMQELLNVINQHFTIENLPSSWPKTRKELDQQYQLFNSVISTAYEINLLNSSQLMSFTLICIPLNLKQVDIFLKELKQENFKGNANLTELVNLLTLFH
ncbi:MAG: hypothetical protein GY928_01650 [Colwellia sp.]|nr:hypothetical protein [Colwellia sp.]